MALRVIAGGMAATSCRIASFNCSIVPGRRMCTLFRLMFVDLQNVGVISAAPCITGIASKLKDLKLFRSAAHAVGLSVVRCSSNSVWPQTFKCEGKAIPVQVYYRARRFQEVESSTFIDSRHMEAVRLSALRTGRLYPPGNIYGTHFC